MEKFSSQAVLHHKAKGSHCHGPLYIKKFSKLYHALKHHEQYQNEKQGEAKRYISNSPNTRPKIGTFLIYRNTKIYYW